MGCSLPSHAYTNPQGSRPVSKKTTAHLLSFSGIIPRCATLLNVLNIFLFRLLSLSYHGDLKAFF